MDRITKAIELAREKNQLNADSPKRRKAKAAAANVANEQVRKVPVDPEHLRKQGIITHADDEHFADAYRLLRTRVLQRMRQNNWNTLGVTSSHPKAGKSFTSINLSATIALDQNYTSLLIDADMRRPSIQSYLGLQADIGLAEYLQRDIPLNEVMLDPGIADLKIVPCVKSVEGTSELLGGPRMLSLVESLRKGSNSEITVFDLPPILVGDDVVSLTSQLDAVLIVVEDGKTQADELGDALELLKDVNVIGTVLNKATDVDLQQYGGYY